MSDLVPFLGEFILYFFMAVCGWLGVFKADRLVGYDGSPGELRKRVRGMKRLGWVCLVCGSLLLVSLLVGRFVGS
jgi:hypothetical protein